MLAIAQKAMNGLRMLRNVVGNVCGNIEVAESIPNRLFQSRAGFSSGSEKRNSWSLLSCMQCILNLGVE